MMIKAETSSETSSVTLRVPASLKRALRELARRERRSLNAQCVHMLAHCVASVALSDAVPAVLVGCDAKRWAAKQASDASAASAASAASGPQLPADCDAVLADCDALSEKEQ